MIGPFADVQTHMCVGERVGIVLSCHLVPRRPVTAETWETTRERLSIKQYSNPHSTVHYCIQQSTVPYTQVRKAVRHCNNSRVQGPGALVGGRRMDRQKPGFCEATETERLTSELWCASGGSPLTSQRQLLGSATTIGAQAPGQEGVDWERRVGCSSRRHSCRNKAQERAKRECPLASQLYACAGAAQLKCTVLYCTVRKVLYRYVL